MELESAIEKIGKLDVLGFPILAGVEALSLQIKTSNKQSLDYIKEKKVDIKFSRYSSSIEKAYLEYCEKKHNEKAYPRNFSLYLDIENSVITHYPYYFYWNGSWEGLDSQLQEEVGVLRGLGFKINYSGYLKEKDIFV